MNERFALEIPYNDNLLPKLQKVMGKDFDKKKRVYTFPETEIFKLAEVLKPFYPKIAGKLQHSQRFSTQRQAAKEAENWIKLSNAKSARFNPPCPSNCEYRDFQKAGIYYSIRKNRDNVLLSDEMGLGKSIITIGTMNYIGAKKALIICKNSAKINWKREILKWSTITDNIIYVDTSTDAKEIMRADYIIINYEALKKWIDVLKKIDFFFVGCDEAHFIKNVNSQRSRFAYELCDKAEYRSLITGSPIVNNTMEMWSLLHLLNPSFWANWYDFAFTYGGAYRDRYTKKICWGKPRNSALFQIDARKTCMIRRLKVDVAKELPPKTRQLIEIEPTSKYSSVIKEQSKYAEKIQKAIERDFDVSDEKNYELMESKFRLGIKRMGGLTNEEFSAIAEIRHKIGILKVPEVIAFSEELLENREKIGIFCYHNDVFKMYMDHFGKMAVGISGLDNNTIRRQQAVDDFQTNNKIRVFIGSIKAAGESITLTKSDICVFGEIDYVPGSMTQCEDRFHRIGTVNPVNCFYVVLQNSIDSNIANIMIYKMGIAEQSTNFKYIKGIIK